jgi:hypothetical protein
MRARVDCGRLCKTPHSSTAAGYLGLICTKWYMTKPALLPNGNVPFELRMDRVL